MHTCDTRHTPTLLTEAEAARILRVAPRTLQDWRYRGVGPRYLSYSRRAVRYRLEDLEAWMRERARRSTSDPGPAEGA